MEIKYTEIAKQSLQENVDFLLKIWTIKEINTLLDDIQKVLTDLHDGKWKQFQKSPFKTRSALIGKKHIRMYFREDKDSIKVLLFFDTRQDPQKIIELLK